MPLFPVYTLQNECQDCYKCIRHCHCKAIRIDNAHATVIPELCVSCGECVRTCPAGAKQIRPDLSRLWNLLSQGEKVYASIAPSFSGYFRNCTINQLAEALQKAGFAGVAETALGAQIVSAAAIEYLNNAPDGVYLSSACPAAVQYVQKYLPEWSTRIVPFDSPLISHCKMLKKELGEDIKTVFFGPCVAKKNEADLYADALTLSLTFEDLEQIFAQKEIVLEELDGIPLCQCEAEEGRLYPFEGGMNDTMRTGEGKVSFLHVSGLAELSAMLSHTSQVIPGAKIFVEMLSCRGGCINGPVMPKNAGNLEVIAGIQQKSGRRNSAGRKLPVDISQHYFEKNCEKDQFSETLIREALASVGKFQPSDELNCGGCGYNSCREFACALIAGKAETAMCHNYLRQNFQRTSNALIKYIPAGVVIVDKSLQVLESNRHFASLLGESAEVIFDSLGSLASIELGELMSFTDLFESVLENGGEIEKFNQPLNRRIVNISVFSITVGETAGAVIQDVTCSELQREQIARKARELIQKNVQTVQQVARVFGEHIAESEMLLEDIAGVYCSENLNGETADD